MNKDKTADINIQADIIKKDWNRGLFWIVLLPVFWTHRLTKAIIRKPRIVIYQLKGAFQRHSQ